MEAQRKDLGITIAEYINDEMEERGIDFAEAVACLDGCPSTNNIWLRFMACDEMFRQNKIIITERSTRKLETIFGVSSATWLKIHAEFLRMNGESDRGTGIRDVRRENN